jgi:hypothetical protein
VVFEVIYRDNEPVFPLGMYYQPQGEGEWDEWMEAGINLLRCSTEEQLDEAGDRGAMAWVPVPLVCRSDGDEKTLRERIGNLRDHPGIVAWEAQDEAIWTACRLDAGVVTNRIYSEPPGVRAAIRARLDDLVDGLRRGSSIARELDPGRKLWLNEAAKSDQETLARCLPYLDVVGYDYYPVPEDPGRGRQMRMLGGFTDRFRRTAPAKDLWVVEQGFTWGALDRASKNKSPVFHEYNSNTWIPMSEEEGRAYPGVQEHRFMAWIAICHGATGLLWFGSGFEDRPSPLLDDLMVVVGELNSLQPFLTAGNVNRVSIITDDRQCPADSGVSGLAKRNGDGTLLAMVNEDYVDHDVFVTGMDWVDSGDLAPVVETPDELKNTGDGLLTTMRGQEVRLYLAR